MTQITLTESGATTADETTINNGTFKDGAPLENPATTKLNEKRQDLRAKLREIDKLTTKGKRLLNKPKNQAVIKAAREQVEQLRSDILVLEAEVTSSPSTTSRMQAAADHWVSLVNNKDVNELTTVAAREPITSLRFTSGGVEGIRLVDGKINVMYTKDLPAELQKIHDAAAIGIKGVAKEHRKNPWHGLPGGEKFHPNIVRDENIDGKTLIAELGLNAQQYADKIAEAMIGQAAEMEHLHDKLETLADELGVEGGLIGLQAEVKAAGKKRAIPEDRKEVFFLMNQMRTAFDHLENAEEVLHKLDKAGLSPPERTRYLGRLKATRSMLDDAHTEYVHSGQRVLGRVRGRMRSGAKTDRRRFSPLRMTNWIDKKTTQGTKIKGEDGKVRVYMRAETLATVAALCAPLPDNFFNDFNPGPAHNQPTRPAPEFGGAARPAPAFDGDDTATAAADAHTPTVAAVDPVEVGNLDADEALGDLFDLEVGPFDDINPPDIRGLAEATDSFAGLESTDGGALTSEQKAAIAKTVRDATIDAVTARFGDDPNTLLNLNVTAVETKELLADTANSCIDTLAGREDLTAPTDRVALSSKLKEACLSTLNEMIGEAYTLWEPTTDAGDDPFAVPADEDRHETGLNLAGGGTDPDVQPQPPLPPHRPPPPPPGAPNPDAN